MRIVVVCPNWIGDAVMATPTLVSLKKTFPESELILVARPYVAPVFQPAPYAADVIPWGKPGGLSTAALAARLRRLDCKLGILLTNSFRSAMLLFLGRVDERVGYARDWRSFLLTDTLQPPRENGRYVPTPMLTYYFDLVQPLGVHDRNLDMKLYTSPADESAADRLYQSLGLDPTRTLVMAPGAAFGLAKCWPPDRFAQVAARAASELGLRTLILCAAADKPMAQRIVEAAAGAALLPPDPLPDLAVTKALVRRARAMVTNDSGLRHFAAAYNIPVVAIFGPTHINWTETWFTKETKLQATVDCGPCQQKRCPEGHLQCMARVSPTMVFDALSALVAKFPYAPPSPETIIAS